jgi:general secretion pathway protein D
VLNLEQVTLGTFAQLVYAELLKKNVNVDQQVLARRDLVTFRSGTHQTAAQIETAARLLLKSYGVSAIDLGGLVRVVPETAGVGNLPEIQRGAAMPETPLPLRPIFHLIDLQAVRQSEVGGYLRTLFGERIRVQEDALRNAIMLSGTPENVQAALEAIRVLDQPALVGGRSLAFTPAFTSADEFARRLIDVLTAQGYAAQLFTSGQAAGMRFPILVLPIAGLNSVYVFARGDAVIAHIEALAASLDRANEQGVGRNFFAYAVKHKDASVLAETLEQLLAGTRPRAAAPAAGQATAPTRPTSVVVDKSTNTLLFQASQEDYPQLVAMLNRLDQPVKAALIEVTVAELLIDDNAQFGVEWAFSGRLPDGLSGLGRTLGGLGVGTGGFTYQVLNSAGTVRATLNALASANKANILSSPRVLARNGETATIQVGQEVPIITSQATGLGTVGTNASVLQTIQYRNTGVILKVKPVIHSADQIDLDVVQEVSAATSTDTGVAASPTFSSRRLDTKLTLQNGSTVLLGGLISEERTDGRSGIPGLKDLPVVGGLFGKQALSGRRRELVVLITPYVVGSNRDAEALTRAFRSMLRPWGSESGEAAREPAPPSAPAGPAPAPR